VEQVVVKEEELIDVRMNWKRTQHSSTAAQHDTKNSRRSGTESR